MAVCSEKINMLARSIFILDKVHFAATILNGLHAADIHTSSSHTATDSLLNSPKKDTKTSKISKFSVSGGFGWLWYVMLQVLLFSGPALVGGSHPRGNPVAPQCSGDGGKVQVMAISMGKYEKIWENMGK